MTLIFDALDDLFFVAAQLVYDVNQSGFLVGAVTRQLYKLAFLYHDKDDDKSTTTTQMMWMTASKASCEKYW